MSSREEVQEKLDLLFGKELAQVWWTVPLPAFGGLTAEQLWTTGRQYVVVDRVTLYL